ncbi:MAG: hypothetical protein ACJ746_21450 [Bryobacteraceae bacterium]
MLLAVGPVFGQGSLGTFSVGGAVRDPGGPGGIGGADRADGFKSRDHAQPNFKRVGRLHFYGWNTGIYLLNTRTRIARPHSSRHP